jgi:hypothetical protein
VDHTHSHRALYGQPSSSITIFIPTVIPTTDHTHHHHYILLQLHVKEEEEEEDKKKSYNSKARARMRNKKWKSFVLLP